MDSIKLNPIEFKVIMQSYAHIEDKEDRHILADKLMMSVLVGLGYSEGIQIFEDMEKWYA